MSPVSSWPHRSPEARPLQRLGSLHREASVRGGPGALDGAPGLSPRPASHEVSPRKSGGAHRACFHIRGRDQLGHRQDTEGEGGPGHTAETDVCRERPCTEAGDTGPNPGPEPLLCPVPPLGEAGKKTEPHSMTRKGSQLGLSLEPRASTGPGSLSCHTARPRCSVPRPHPPHWPP